MASTFKPETVVGPAGSLKTSAINAADAVARQEAKESKEATKQQDVAVPGTIIYKKIGYPVFNCVLSNRKKLSFTAGTLVVSPDNPEAKIINETLRHFVDNGTLTEEVKSV